MAFGVAAMHLSTKNTLLDAPREDNGAGPRPWLLDVPGWRRPFRLFSPMSPWRQTVAAQTYFLPKSSEFTILAGGVLLKCEKSSS